LLAVLPLAIVMVAGPQIVSAVLLATTPRARANSLAFLGGVAAATSLGTTIVYVVARNLDLRPPSGDSGAQPVDYVLIGLLVALMIRVYLRRHDTEPPKWMGRLTAATPAFALKLGLLLFLLMPTDVLTMITVGTYLVEHGSPWVHMLPFLLVTLLFAGAPLLIVLAMGRRAEELLPTIRDWMTENSWMVNEVVLAFFLIVTVAGIA